MTSFDGFERMVDNGSKTPSTRQLGFQKDLFVQLSDVVRVQFVKLAPRRVMSGQGRDPLCWSQLWFSCSGFTNHTGGEITTRSTGDCNALDLTTDFWDFNGDSSTVADVESLAGERLPLRYVPPTTYFIIPAVSIIINQVSTMNHQQP